MRITLTFFALLLTNVLSFHFHSSYSARREHQALFAKARKARRSKKVERSRPQQFYDAIEEAQGKEPKPATTTASPDELQEEADREARMAEARRRMDERPDVSTIIVDEETGIEVVAQGKSVMDVVTRKPVQLSSLGPMYRLAQLFPGVPPEVREKYRLDWRTVQVPEIVEQLRQACTVKLADDTFGIPPHPSIANKAIDFVLANRDRLGREMKNTLGRLTLRSMAEGNKDEALEYKKLWKNFLTIENHISGPFRQMIMDAEGRVGPNFGNLDISSFCDGEVYERCANYLVLKGMVAHWEKKVVDADYTERTPQAKDNYMTVLAHGDPRRYLPDPPILFTLKECTQVCFMAQQMTKAFVEKPELFNDLPPEVRFMEFALSIRGGTPLRKFMIEDFCPAEGITPVALREGLRRLMAQLENMQIDPYADITNLLERLIIATSQGTDDERNPYLPYVANTDLSGPGAFPTYTFNHDKLSLVRFLDSQYERQGSAGAAPPVVGGVGNLFGFGKSAAAQAAAKAPVQSGDIYKVPPVRAAGRPHELGWLNLLDDVEEKDMRLGKVPPGKIVADQD